jgi:hypothetical protein
LTPPSLLPPPPSPPPSPPPPSPPPPPPPMPPPVVCQHGVNMFCENSAATVNTMAGSSSINDNVCQDGRTGTGYPLLEHGKDCGDCGGACCEGCGFLGLPTPSLDETSCPCFGAKEGDTIDVLAPVLPPPLLQPYIPPLPPSLPTPPQPPPTPPRPPPFNGL